jgi:C-terminal peptidase prc
MKPAHLLLLAVLLSCATRQRGAEAEWLHPGGSGDPVVEQARTLLMAKHPNGDRLANTVSPPDSRSRTTQSLLAVLGDPSTRLMSAAAWASFLAEVSGEATVGVGLRELLDLDDAPARDPGVLGIEGEPARVRIAPGRFLVVITTQSGGPAARAGIAPGDVLESVDGETAFDLGQVMARLRGAAGTEVRLGLRRAGRLQIVSLRREALPAGGDHVRSGMLEGGIVHLAIDGFSKDTSAAAEKALQDGAERGVVLDLRNNPGGAVDAALAVAGAFLGEREVIRTVGKLDAPVLRSAGSARVRGKVVVLTNAGTASAAELLAAALRDTGRARLVGEPTAGKALVHAPAPLDDGSVLLISVGRLVRMDGTEILGRGVVPDERVAWPGSVHPPLPVPGQPASDPQLAAALASLRR